MLLSSLASVRQEERRVISEGIKGFLAHMKATHEQIVGGPYGWQDSCDGLHLEASAEEQAIVQAEHELNKRGLSLRQVGYELTDRACIRHLVALGIPKACRTC
jgi:hypothetical protein